MLHYAFRGGKMSDIIKLISISIFLILLSTSLHSENYILVKNGKPNCVIVISERPKKAVQLASYELQYHLKLITGAEIPIVKDNKDNEEIKGLKILVGESKYTDKLRPPKDLKTQEYIIKFFPDSIVLLGKDKDDYGEVKYNDLDGYKTFPDFYDQQATLYAVYDFLERYLGVRWFNPTDYGTFYPEKNTLIVKEKDIRRKPFLLMRDVHWTTYNSEIHNWSTSGLWKGTYNNPDDPDYKRYMEIAYEKLRKKYPKENEFIEAKRTQINLFLHRMRVGGEKYSCNHSLYGYYERFWGEKATEGNRPEFFAKGYEGKPPQLCYTNPELIKQVAQDARDYYDGKKTAKDLKIFWNPQLPNPFPIEPMDNSSYCKCENCQKLINKKWENSPYYSTGLHSNYFFNFVNEVAKELKKTHPDKYVITLAYSSHAYPPDFEIEPNILIDFCFASNRGPEGAGNYQNELKALNEWRKKIKDRPIFLWLYYTFPKEFADSGNFYCFPGFFAHQIDKQFKLFEEYRIGGILHCGYGQEVEAYVTYKLMDEPSLNIEELLNDYFKNMYGNGWKEMKEFYLPIEKRYADINNYPEKKYSANMETSWGYLGNDEVMEKLKNYLEKAKEKENREEYRKRIDMFEKAIWAYMEKGKNQYDEIKKAEIPKIKVPKIESKRGDIEKVDFEKCISLTDFYIKGSNENSKRKYNVRMCHDGEFLYIELIDFCNVKDLYVSPTVFCYDDWEIFLTKEKGGSIYRQYSFGPTGLSVFLANGEINFANNVHIEIKNAKVVSDTKSSDKWITKLSLPFSEMLPGGIKEGDKFYLNIIRVISPELSKKYPFEIETLVPYTTVHQTNRMAEIIMEKEMK